MSDSRGTSFSSNTLYGLRLYSYRTSWLSGGYWKECWLLLQRDGTLTWFNNKQLSRVRNKMHVTQCDMVYGISALSSGPNVQRPLVKPTFWDDPFCYFIICSKSNAFGNRSHQWFYAKNRFDLVAWLSALATFYGVSVDFKLIIDDALIQPIATPESHLYSGIEMQNLNRRWALSVYMTGDGELPYINDSGELYAKLLNLTERKKNKAPHKPSVQRMLSGRVPNSSTNAVAECGPERKEASIEVSRL